MLAKQRLLTVCALISCIIIASCKKYPEGPTISLIPRKERISNKWKVDKVFHGTNDSTNAFRNWVIEFTNKGTMIFDNGNTKKTGSWQLNNSGADLDAFFDDNTVFFRSKILKLEQKALWYRTKGDELEFRLAPVD